MVITQITTSQPPATSHQPPATSHQPPATSHQPPTTSHMCDNGMMMLLFVAQQNQLQQRLSEQRLAAKRLAAQRLEDPRLEDQRFEAQRIAAQLLVEQSLEDQRLASQRLAQRLEVQRLEEQCLEARRKCLEAQRLETQRLETRRQCLAAQRLAAQLAAIQYQDANISDECLDRMRYVPGANIVVEEVRDDEEEKVRDDEEEEVRDDEGEEVRKESLCTPVQKPRKLKVPSAPRRLRRGSIRRLRCSANKVASDAAPSKREMLFRDTSAHKAVSKEAGQPSKRGCIEGPDTTIVEYAKDHPDEVPARFSRLKTYGRMTMALRKYLKTRFPKTHEDHEARDSGRGRVYMFYAKDICDFMDYARGDTSSSSDDDDSD